MTHEHIYFVVVSAVVLILGLVVMAVCAICSYMQDERLRKSAKKEILSDFKEKLKESDPSSDRDLLKISYAIDSLLFQFRRWRNIEPSYEYGANYGIKCISRALLVLRAMDMYQGDKELNESENKLYEEVMLGECSTDVKLKYVANLVKSSMIYATKYGSDDFPERKFVVHRMSATLELFVQGIESVEAKVAAKNKRSIPTDLENMGKSSAYGSLYPNLAL